MSCYRAFLSAFGLLALVALLPAAPAHAACSPTYPFSSNCPLPASGLNAAISGRAAVDGSNFTLPNARTNLGVPPLDLSTVTLPGARDNLNAGLIQRSVLDFGAKCDVVNVAGGSYTIPAGSTTLTLTSGSFSAIGTAKRAVLPGHGTGGATLVTTITPTGTTTATLGAASVPGTISQFVISAAVNAAGTGYAPGDTITETGGTLAATGGANAVLTVQRTKVVSATVAAGGTGGTNGTQTVYGTTGNGNRFIASVTVAGGAITAVGSIVDGGHYTSNPTARTTEPVAGATPGVTAPTGGQLNVVMGVDQTSPTTPGLYANGGVPANPAAQGSTSGSGTGATFNLVAAFNNSGFSYGTDDQAAFQTALNPSTWSAGQGGAQQGATITMPGKTCGIASTVTVSATGSTRLLGTQPGTIGFQPATINGSAVQWLGALGGTMFAWAPPSGAANFNGIANVAFSCGTPNSGGQSYSVPLAGIGLNILSQHKGDWGWLYFDQCSAEDIFISAVATTGRDSLLNSFHDLYLQHPLDWDGIGIYSTGNLTGDSDYNIFKRIDGIYKNRPLMYMAVLDNNRIESVHFSQRSGGATNAYGVDISGSIYGSTDVQPPQDTTMIMTNLSSTSVMRGLESAATPPTGVQIYGFDTTNSVAKTVVQPGAGNIMWVDENGLIGGSAAATLVAGGGLNVGRNMPAMAFVESQGAAASCRTNSGTSGGNASRYTCNSSQGAFDVFDNMGGQSWFDRWNGTLLLSAMNGTVAPREFKYPVQVDGSNTNTALTPVSGMAFFTGRNGSNALNAGQTSGDIEFQFGGVGGGFRNFLVTNHNNVAGSGNSFRFYVNNGTTAGASTAPGTNNTEVLRADGSGAITNPVGGGTVVFTGASSGTTVVGPASVASGILTLPAATDTLVGKATTDTLTNKTLTSPKVTVTVVASLPTCNGAAEGTSSAVSDANAPTYNATVVGGGAVHIPVYCNGTNWTAH